MRIGELAQRAGVGVDTVRYYEREGILPPADRADSGYRRYRPDDVARLQFVRRAKALGFTLTEIAELLALSAQRGADMEAMRTAAETRLADVNAKLAELERMRAGLQTLITACPGHGALATCPILAALTQETRHDGP